MFNNTSFRTACLLEASLLSILGSRAPCEPERHSKARHRKGQPSTRWRFTGLGHPGRHGVERSEHGCKAVERAASRTMHKLAFSVNVCGHVPTRVQRQLLDLRYQGVNVALGASRVPPAVELLL